MSKRDSSSVTSLPSTCLSLHFSSTFSFSLFVILTFSALSSSLGDIIFPFLFFRLSLVSISGKDVLFRKLSISGYFLPISSLYLGSPVYLSLSKFYILGSLFPSYNYVLLVYVPLQNVGFHGTPVSVHLSIPPLIVHIC